MDMDILLGIQKINLSHSIKEIMLMI